MPPVTLDLNKSAADQSTRRGLSNLSLAVAKCKKIVVVTGAGISCSCGIPDFRSSDGLYSLVKEQYPDAVLKGRDLFDASLFRDPTSSAVFYTFISQLKRSIDGASPSSTHRFIKTLDQKSKLLRSYTQNIDGLEERSGLLGSSSQDARSASSSKGKGKLRIRDVRNVQLHGDIHRVRCTFCSAEMPCTEEHLRQFETGVPPPCPECTDRSEARVARSARPIKVGTLRPAIVLYDEPHPLGDDIGCIQTSDLTRKPDMLIIMGTSLKVHGFKKLVKEFSKTVHDSAPSSASVASSSSNPIKSKPKLHAGKVIFVNKTPPGSEWDGIIDFHVVGETDKWCERVLEDWKKVKPSDWEVQKTLDKDLKVVKEITNTISAPVGKGKGKQPILGAKRKKDIFNEDHSILSPSALPRTKLRPTPLSAPSSPSKRRLSGTHYSSDAEQNSPTKKRDSRPTLSKENIDFDGRGMLFGDSTNNTRDQLSVMDSISKGRRDIFDDMTLEQGSISVGGVPRPKSRAEVKNRAEVVVDGLKPNTRLQVKRSMRTLRSASVKGKAC
ncbi:hypothetical protein QCA50_002533 [Cerrena zonata]|uniref:Deacetylase sirtuin-type domain-containing protein n=1 Tax=Cerrena zonata TaxID=2478898 RepID=A0AAW0GTL6_9APHY